MHYIVKMWKVWSTSKETIKLCGGEFFWDIRIFLNKVVCNGTGKLIEKDLK